MTKRILFGLLTFFCVTNLLGQSITTGSLTGKVTTVEKQPLANVNIVLTHIPSGSQYGTTSGNEGRFLVSGLRIGGPYQLIASHVGYAPQKIENFFIDLGGMANFELNLKETSIQLEEEVVLGASLSPVIHPDRTGASSQIDKKMLERLPTISRKISDFTRVTPQIKGSSYLGQNNVLNNYTIDGSSFNNSFGLASQPGERTGVAPISLEALEQIQVNVAPFDVRQANFLGAGVNMVTKSGTNEFQSALYYQTRNQAFVGTKAAGAAFNPGTFSFNMGGGYLAGPIIKDRLFFFASFEHEKYVRPATSFVANDGTQEVGGNITRVMKSDLDQLRTFLKSNFNYETGAYDQYNFTTLATRFIFKLDYNLDVRNKISIRYSHLDSRSDQPIANHNVLGFGYRRGSTSSLNFQNSNYAINENIRSLIAEWNSTIGKTLTNNFIAGYRFHDETRVSAERLFPFVDILKDGTTYTSFGTEPFTPYAGVTYGSFQLQDNLTWMLNKHSFLLGINVERFQSTDNFFPGAQSVYVYNSLEDFYTDANSYLANPMHNQSTVNLRRFQVRYSNIPGVENPVQPLKVLYSGMYFQDKWDVSERFRLTFGLRFDLPLFEDSGYENMQAAQLDFKDENGQTVRYSTKKMPDANLLVSPRLGFNWDVAGKHKTQIRGGSGLFAAQPPYVCISNQIGNNGVLTGYEALSGSPTSPLYSRPFSPDINTYKPKNVTGQPAAVYELALVDPEFRFPQIWRSNLAVDQSLPWDLVATIEFIYDKDINGINYINSNLSEPNGAFNGPDQRPRWTGSNRIHGNIANAVVLKNESKGYAWNMAGSVERRFKEGLFGKVGYSYGESKNVMEPTSIASASWGYNAVSNHPNKPELSFSMFSPGHRLFAAISYSHKFFKFGTTSVSIFYERFSPGRNSYVYAGDLNGDGGFSNDLIYIPTDRSNMNFQEYTSGSRTFTVVQQEEAWENYIKQDRYLNSRRGQYAERFGVELPYVGRADASLSQSFKASVFGKNNEFVVRLDIINLGNLLNKNWGVAQNLATPQPIIVAGIDPQGKPLFRLNAFNGELIRNTFIKTATLSDVHQMQLSVKWMFNQ